jgi:DNA-binding CsgD family transcriptional regulator
MEKQYVRHGKTWTKIENQRFRLLYPKYSIRWLIRNFGRTSSAILTQACILGLHKDAQKGYRFPLSDWKKWTNKEINFLKKHYKIMTFTQVADAMGRSCNSIATRIARMGIKKAKFWTPKEDDRLRRIYRRHSLEELSKIFKRAPGTVFTRARKLKIPKRARPFSSEELKYLTKNYHLMPVDQIAQKLNRLTIVVAQKARKLGLKNKFIDKRYWTQKEEKYIRRWYNKKSLSDIAKFFKSTPKAVLTHARQMGLHRKMTHSYWTAGEERKLKKLYPKYSTKCLSREFGKGPASISHKAYKLGLRKDVTQGYKKPASCYTNN